jgi:hypothetical protein
MLPSLVGASATNDLFYYNTIGRLLDLFFTRDSYDMETPGSGFTDWLVTFRRRKTYQIEGVWRIVSGFFWMGVWLVGVFLMRVLCKVVGTPSHIDEIERMFRYMEENAGAAPPWVLEKQVEKVPEVVRGIRGNVLSDELIFVCGPGGCLETVVDGDFEGAVARRRALRTFA